MMMVNTQNRFLVADRKGETEKLIKLEDLLALSLRNFVIWKKNGLLHKLKFLTRFERFGSLWLITIYC